MNSHRWFAILGCLIILNTCTVSGVSAPSDLRYSFLSFQTQPPPLHWHSAFCRSRHPLCRAYRRSVSGVSPAAAAVASPSLSSAATDANPLKAAAAGDDLFNQLKQWLVSNGAVLDVDGLALLHHSESEYEAIGGGEKAQKHLTSLRSYPRNAVIASVPSSLHFSHGTLEQLLAPLLCSKDELNAEKTILWRNEEKPDPSKGFLDFLSSSRTKTDVRIRLSFMLAAFQHLFDSNSPFFLSFLRPTAPHPPVPAPSPSFPSSFSSLMRGWLLYLLLLPLPSSSIPLLWTAPELRALNHPIANAVFSRLHCLYTAFSLNSHLLRGKAAPATQPGGPPGAPLGAPHSPLNLNQDGMLFRKVVAAHATVSSRALRLPRESCALVPLVDFCVHATESPNAKLQFKTNSSSSSSKCSCSNSSSSVGTEQAGACSGAQAAAEVSVQLVALRDIAAGERISISFGDEIDNPTLLLNYGLLPKDNP
ncbi:hypothetical protein, conserved [Eimeria brunetti]|uniref:SET domain-containing protein n=1 Tax=Eimeria brunetti TaxID=51314 RepID=U6LLM1_9EIME|nr:hypothetical protein, conserved [Eimeria brunetti]